MTTGYETCHEDKNTQNGKIYSMYGIIILQSAIRFLCKICEPFLNIKNSSKK
jgi:hypothetical protein